MSGQVDLAALRALEAAATPGPWAVGSQYGLVDVFRHPYSPGDDMVAEQVDAYDAALIAAARNALPALLDEVATLRAQVAAVAALADEWGRASPSGAAAVRLALEVVRLRATVARVEALALEWEVWAWQRSTPRVDAFRDAAAALRDALTEPKP